MKLFLSMNHLPWLNDLSENVKMNYTLGKCSKSIYLPVDMFQ